MYGPPAAGKDTVTFNLAAIDRRYVHFHRLKVGTGRTVGYRCGSGATLADLRDRGALLYTNERYDATYAIDRPGLDEIVDHGDVPVVHLGQIAGIAAVAEHYPLDWLVVALWCSRDEVTQRLLERGDMNSAERLIAWDETLTDLRTADPALFTLVINTARISSDNAARLIDTCCR